MPDGSKGDTGRVFVFLGDGELQEGQTWEAVQSIAYQKLDNITVLIDVNGQQCDGRTDEIMGMEPLTDKFTAFGWSAVKVDGHDLEAMSLACTSPHPGQPRVVLAYTSPYQGIPALEERYPNLHYVRFRSDEERALLRRGLRRNANAGGWRMKLESQVHRRSLVQWGKLQPETIVLSGDLTVACEADGFQQAYPDRFISMGLMEQNMIGFAAGLAREGFVPLVHTFAVFMYRRALDQTEMSVAYGDVPVRMFGFLPV